MDTGQILSLYVHLTIVLVITVNQGFIAYRPCLSLSA